MNWVTAIWSMVTATYLSLAAMQAVVWFHRRKQWGSLLFALTSAATAVYAGCEYWMMHAGTPAEFATALRWLHVPAWVLLISIVGFVRVYFGVGRTWLLWTVVVTRSVSLLVNFVAEQNLNYRTITDLHHVSFLGETIAEPVGELSAWMILGQFSLLCAIVFLVDAAITFWRSGQQRRGLLLGGSILFFLAGTMVQAWLAFASQAELPLMNSLFFLPVVAAMSYETAMADVRAEVLTDDLGRIEEWLLLATEAGGVAVLMWDVARNHVWVTAGSTQVGAFGIRLDGSPTIDDVLERIHPGDRERVETAIRNAVESGGDYSVETRVLLPGGGERWIASRGRMFAAAHGNPPRLLGTVIDITTRKLAEHKLEQNRDELAHLSRATVLSVLSASIAHELNQPLAIILSNAQAAQDLLEQDPPSLVEVKEILADIVAADRRASEIIRRLRALLKPGETSLQPLSINEVVQEVLDLVRGDLVRRGVDVVLNLEPGLADVLGDRVQLQQLALNLIVNAADAMAANEPGTRRLHVASARHEDCVRVSVRDEGIGLPADSAHFFQPFFTTKTDGLGMGLTICQSIAAAHHGRLWSEPHPERGAVFYFEVPVVAAAVDS